MVDTPRLQWGNRKLPRTTGIWNLPSGITCPNSTDECRKHCYAKKAERMYPQTLPFRHINLKLSQFSDIFIETIADEIHRKKRCYAIRIHESGDFWSQSYLNDWIDLAKMFPDIVFYAYTKSYHLDFSKRPKNMLVLLSDDKSELKEHWEDFDGVTRVSDNPKLADNEILCPNDCKLCDCCFNIYRAGKRLVVFKKH